MNPAQKLRQRLTRWIYADMAATSAASKYSSRGANGQSDPESPRRGRLVLENLESRQMLAGDVEFLSTDPSAVDTSAATEVSTGNDRGESERAAEGEPGFDLVALAQHLDTQGFDFYGANWCPACTQQKQLFEDGGDDLPFTEVTLADRTLDPNFNFVFQGQDNPQYPTWITPTDERLVGVQSVETLAQLSGFVNTNNENPLFESIGSQTVRIGSPLHIPVDGYDAEGGPLTVTVTVDDPSLLEATVLTGNRSLRLDMNGFGDMVFELFEQRAPVAAGRVASLAQDGFYDGIIFHRVVDGFVIQGGDPTGTGTSGSTLGTFDDDFHPDLQHNRTGVLSFAKSSDDTNNSQFFVTEVETRFLDFNHSIFGQLVEGEDVREAISGMAVGANDKPVTDITIDNATVFNDTENSVVMLKALGGTGTTNVTFTITDEDGNTFSEVVPVTIAADVDSQGFAVNSQPFLGPVTTPAASATTTSTLQLTSVDVEGDPVQYFASTSNTNATASVDASTGLVTVSTPDNFTGTVNVNVGVRAATGAGSNSDTQLVSFEFSQQTIAVPTSIDLRSSSDSGSSDTDNITSVGAMTFDIAGVTPGATVQIIDINDNTVLGVGTATGSTIAITTNNLAAIGQGTYELAARQVVGNNTGAASTPIVVVYDTTPTSFLSSSVDSLANVNTPYTTDLVSTEEGSGAIYRFDAAPTGATIVPGTGVINWTPTSQQLGANSFTVTLTDAAGNERSDTFSVQVEGEPLAGVRLEVTDLAGNVITSVGTGDEFQLRIYGQDTRPRSERGGVYATFTDVRFDGTLVRAVPGTQIEYGSGFGNVQKGTLSTGLFDEVGAVSVSTAPTNEAEALIATIRMEALGTGSVNFVADPADDSNSEVLLFFNDDQIPASAINYQSIPLAIGQSFTAVADTFTVSEDSSATVLDVLANDTVVSGNGTLSVVSVTQPTSGGTVSLNGGEVSFTPLSDFVGTAEFTYRVADSGGVQQDVPVTVTVSNVNDPPVGVADSFTVDAGSGANSLDVLANEADQAEPGETLSITAVSTPSNGGSAAVSSNGLRINYTPASGFTGNETFTYTLSDGTSTDEVSVSIVVNPIDDPPTAVADSFPASGDPAILEDSAEASYDVLANDTRDADNQAFIITSVGTASAGGTVSFNSAGTELLYRPAADFNGTETVTYTIRDTGGGLATATVTFTVEGVNDPPPIVASDETIVLGASDVVVLTTAQLPTNPDTGEVLRFINLGTTSAGGTATISTDGSEIRYTPASDTFTGDDTFTFEVEDPEGLTSGPVTMTVHVVDYERRDFFFNLDRLSGNMFAGNLGAISLSGTNILGESVSFALNDSSVQTSADGLNIPDLLPGSYQVNIPAIPFLQNTAEARTINIDSQPEDGDASIDLDLGPLQSRYISVADWFGSAPRRAALVAIRPGGEMLFVQPRGAAASKYSDIEVELNADGDAISVRAQNGTSPVNGSANVSEFRKVQTRGLEGDARLVLVDLDSVLPEPADTSTSTQSVSSPSAANSSDSSGAPSGEPLDSSVLGAITVADVVVPASDGSLRQPAGEPLAASSVNNGSLQPTNKLVGDTADASGVDAAMPDVTESLQRVSGAGDAVAEADSQPLQSFQDAVDLVLTQSDK